MKKILIFGGNGFIGSFLADLLSVNYKVTIASQYNIKNKKLRFNYKVFKYTEKNIYDYLKENKFNIIHFLSGNPHPNFSLNDPFVDIVQTVNPLLSILNVLKRTSYNGVLWVSSSVAVYGNCKDKFLNENSECIPLSNYAVAKLTVENYAKIYSKYYGLDIGIYRIFSTYGPGLERQVIFDNIVKIINNEPNIFLMCSEKSARDLSYVKDQVSAIKLLNDNIIPKGDIYNIGSGKATKIVNVVKKIAKILNYKGSITCSSESNSHDVSWSADISKIKSLGFNQTYSMCSGLKETIKYLTK